MSGVAYGRASDVRRQTRKSGLGVFVSTWITQEKRRTSGRLPFVLHLELLSRGSRYFQFFGIGYVNASNGNIKIGRIVRLWKANRSADICLTSISYRWKNPPNASRTWLTSV